MRQNRGRRSPTLQAPARNVRGRQTNAARQGSRRLPREHGRRALGRRPRGKVSRELRLLGIGVGLSVAAMDFYYAGIRRRIWPVYLLNGAAQLTFAALWGVTGVNETRELRRAPEAAFA